MKIGILTFHRAINYGAFMQGYSLATRIKKEFPKVDVEIIDYNAKARENFILKCPLVFMYRRSISQGVEKMIQTRVFKKSLHNLPLSKRMVSWKDKDVQAYINEKYDIVIVGSDAVFNWNDIGLPNPYFLREVNKCNKLSYAASAHLQRFMELEDAKKMYLNNCLSEFCYLGVRDNNTERFVRFFSDNQEIYHNCDPSIFLEMSFPEERLKEKLERHAFDYNKKTIFLMLMHPEYGKYAKDYFGSEYQFVSLMDGNPYSDIYLFDLSPFEWGHVFRYGYCLITDYFHGTIFGLKNQIPVMSIDASKYQGDQYESKAYDLLNNRLKLPEIYVNSTYISGNQGYEHFCTCMDRILQNYDQKRISKAIEEEAATFGSFRAAIQTIIGY